MVAMIPPLPQADVTYYRTLRYDRNRGVYYVSTFHHLDRECRGFSPHSHLVRVRYHHPERLLEADYRWGRWRWYCLHCTGEEIRRQWELLRQAGETAREAASTGGANPRTTKEGGLP